MDIGVLNKQAEKYLSSIRMYRFNEVDSISPMAVYLENIQLSQHVFSIISILEVILRNKVDNIMKCNYGEGYLSIDNQIFNEYEKKLIGRATDKVKKKKLQVMNSRILTELTFGFWMELLKNHKIWCTCLNKLFSRETRQAISFKEIRKRVNAIINIRNMIAHHQRIINKDDYKIKNAPEWASEIILWLISDSDKLFKNEIKKYLEKTLKKISAHRNRYEKNQGPYI